MKKEFVVTEELTAKVMGSGSLPVLATPAVVAMLENLACTACEVVLTPEETTVGARIDLKHLRPSAVGEKIYCEVVEMKQEGAKLYFELAATNVSGQKIATATHKRAIVKKDTFMASLS